MAINVSLLYFGHLKIERSLTLGKATLGKALATSPEGRRPILQILFPRAGKGKRPVCSFLWSGALPAWFPVLLPLLLSFSSQVLLFDT